MAALDRCYNIADLRAAAQHRLPRGVFEFVDRGSEDEVALRNNRAGFERIKLRHRALVDVSGRSMATTLFGAPVSMPMAIAPTGAAGLCWYEGELELAKAAAKAKIPFTLATGAMTSMEKIAEQAGPGVGGRLWFQLYVWNRRELSYQLIERAKAAGFEALIVTVDTIVSPNREYNARNGFLLPFHPTVRFTADIMRHPTWAASVLLKYFTTIGMPRNENYPEPYRRPVTSNVSGFEVTRRRYGSGKFSLRGMPMVVKYFSSTLAAQVGWRMMSTVKRTVGWNGSRKPLRALYSRFGGTMVSTVTISASNPAALARSISW